MNVLCPTDFSASSQNAIHWIANYLERMNAGTIELLHCIDAPTVLDGQETIGQLLQEHAERNMSNFEKDLKHQFGNIKINTVIYKTNPKAFITQKANEINADVIVVGTSGFTNLKDITVGSVTEYISHNSAIPVLAIPPNSQYKGLHKIIVGVDKNELKHPDSFKQLVHLVHSQKPEIHLTQVLDKGEHLMQFDYRIEDFLKDLYYEHHGIERTEMVAASISKFAQDVDADMLCMIHHRSNWLRRQLHHSITKDVLFNLKIPFLIIPDVAVPIEPKMDVTM